MIAKVFCIGFHKTGTSSMRDALRIMGYRVTGPNGVNDPNIKKNLPQLTRRISAKYDAFQDNPWPLVYREMDALFPGSKFILTERDPDAWLTSQVNYFGTSATPMRELIYGVGCPVGNELRYREVFLRHTRDVLAYFRDRPDRLLRMDLAAGSGWQELCAFLGHPVPDVPFPHSNRAADRQNRPKASLIARLHTGMRRFVDERTPF